MSYAIRNDALGWRSVGSADDVGPDEHFSEHPPAPAARTAAKAEAEGLADIDAAADAAYTRIAGSAGRVAEYERAFAEASAYKDSGYAGAAGQAVVSWAQAKNWTNQQATDDIIAAKAVFDGALYGIRSIRLNGKEAVRAAATAEAKDAAAAAVVSQLKAVGITA